MIDIEKKSKFMELLSWFTFFILGLVLMVLMLWSTILDVILGYRQLNNVDNSVDVDNTSLSICDTVITDNRFVSNPMGAKISFFGASSSQPTTGNSYIYRDCFVTFDISNNGCNINLGVRDGSYTTSSSYNLINYVFDHWNKFSFPVTYRNSSTGQVLYGRVFSIYRITSGFNYNVVKFRYGIDVSYYGDATYRTTYFEFFDNNGNSFGLQFCFYSNTYVAGVDTRPISMYFFESSLSSDSVYLAGVEYGMAEGISIGREQGYNDGFTAGQYVGREAGYEQGIIDSTDYTFLGLIGAVVDVPIRSFTSLLNFEIFGFNLFNLFTGLITLSIIFVFVRLVFFRK